MNDKCSIVHIFSKMNVKFIQNQKKLFKLFFYIKCKIYQMINVPKPFAKNMCMCCFVTFVS